MTAIRKAIEDNDPKNEKFQQINTALQLLEKLSDLKLEHLEGKVKDQLADPKKFKTTHEEETKAGTHIAASDDANAISNALDGIIGGFCAGSSDGTRKAVKGIVNTAMNAILGSAAGTESYQLSYAAFAEDEILKRLDVAYWSYGIAATGITSKQQSAMAYVCKKSYIDAADVHATELVSMYRQAARLAGNKEDEKSILEALDEAQKVLKKMKDDPMHALENHTALLTKRLLA